MYKIIIISFILICSGCNNNRNHKVLNKELNILSPKDKIWAHRVNSLNDIKDRVDDFHGIEVDIFYNKTDDNFEVKHDIDSKGINLENFLDSVLKVKEVLFWFDYKNLNEQPNAGISKLSAILSERKLENTSFVESYYASDLERFDEKMATSYWVSAIQVPTQKVKRDKLYKEKYKHIQSLNVSMLSASYEMFDFLTDYFPLYKCNYWMSGSLSKEKIVILNKMALSSNVNIILIDGNQNLLK
tara:strand:- start:4347 stop:5075 length:729 start_codon:yes stop_codon:yes gene_type:complete